MSHKERNQPQRAGTSSDRRCPQKFSASENVVSNENLFGNHSFGASTPMTRMAAQIPTVEQSLGVMKHSPTPKLRQPQQHLNQPTVWPIDADASRLPGLRRQPLALLL